MNPAETLDRLIADGIVDAVVQRVKTGKEAEVFVVRKGDAYLAAKVYKERTARTFKNNVGYKEGRQIRNTRDARAIAKNTKYGRNLSESDWMHTEHDALVTLTAAGVRVPKAELFYEGTLLMELVLDAEGQPAPRLIECPLSEEQAYAFHRELVGMIVKMLSCDLIHGDLSPYNVLLGWNGPTIIDLPQVVKAAHNSQSEQFLVRDVRNVTEFFARFAPGLRSRVSDGFAIWRKYTRRELAPDYFPEEGEGLAAKPMDDVRRKQGRAHRPQHGGPHAPAKPPAPAAKPHAPAPAAKPHAPAAKPHAPAATPHAPAPAAKPHAPAAKPHAPAPAAHHPPAHPPPSHREPSHRPTHTNGAAHPPSHSRPAHPQPPRPPASGAPQKRRHPEPRHPRPGPEVVRVSRPQGHPNHAPRPHGEKPHADKAHADKAHGERSHGGHRTSHPRHRHTVSRDK